VGLHKDFMRDVDAFLGEPVAETSVLSENDMHHLPAAVQDYLRFVGAVGKPRVRDYHVHFTGGLRADADSPWMKTSANQFSSVDPAARLFLIKASRAGIPFLAYHRYVGLHATFKVRIASLLTVVDAKGPEMDRGETVTLLNDMCLLAPATLAESGLTWEELSGREVRVTFTNAGHTVSATLKFHESGALADFVSEDRSRTTDGRSYERLPWSTPIESWRAVGDRRLPGYATAVWHGKNGPFEYAHFENPEIEYNVVRE